MLLEKERETHDGQHLKFIFPNSMHCVHTYSNKHKAILSNKKYDLHKTPT